MLSLTGHIGDIYCVRYSPDGRRLATAGKDCTAAIWDAEDGTCLQVLSGHQGEVNSVSFAADSHQVATACDDGSVRSLGC